MNSGVTEYDAPRYHRLLFGVAGLPSLSRAISPAPSLSASNLTQPATVERRSFSELLVSPANAPGPPRNSSTASARPQFATSYLASTDHCRQAWSSGLPWPGQLVPPGLGPAFTASRPRLYVAPT